MSKELSRKRPKSLFDFGIKKQKLCEDAADIVIPPECQVDVRTGDETLTATTTSDTRWDVSSCKQQDFSLTREEKFRYIKNLWYPPSRYEFPKKEEYGKMRAFNAAWLQQFNWLAYSSKEDGAYCLPCVLFGVQAGKNSHKLDRLMTSPLTTWTSALRKLKEHDSTSEVHKSAMVTYVEFKNSMESKSVPVIQQLDHALAKRVAENRAKLASIVKTVLLCGRQNLALRGHRDDSSFFDDSSNTGNFQKLIEFRVDAGDTILGTHCQDAPKNATYRSKTIQNELIDCCREIVITKIAEKVKKAEFFTIMADEATDCSNKEQLPLVLRYYDGSIGKVREDFIGYQECGEGISGAAIAKLIQTTVSDLGLSMDKCRGQCYDGAGNMAGKVNGAAARIKAEYPKAVYVHCLSHQLNLCVMKACAIQMIRNFLGVTTELANFFNYSPKKQGILDASVEEMLPESKISKLKAQCRTRWIERLDSLDNLHDLYGPVVDALDTIKTDPLSSCDTITKATSLVNAVTQSDFIFSLAVCKDILQYTRGLTTKLQGREEEVHQAYANAQVVVTTLKSLREKVDELSSELLEKAETLAARVDIVLAKPRACGRQRHRDNTPATTTEEYYRRNLIIPFLDNLILELTTRFEDNQAASVAFVRSILPVAVAQPSWEADILKMSKCYFDDLPHPDSLPAEMKLWATYWTSHPSSAPDSISKTLQLVDTDMFPNLTTLLKIASALPSTTCECERSVSALRRIKSYLRSSMSQDRLNGLALLHVHYNMEIDVNAVIDLFARRQPRRMRLVNIFQD
ncbi:52 kDa repressor of the inhibitor of the protein kinase [Lingula anatina]|uniref:52 kDa repressor of the inhibitor of the protein kinase n=1 Tax=Lingula anatina TaxID=7574 RepID=A0A1S3IYQ7_LINAN|nr:52 kDa repressor of the inhibitor of the protein kinase [Lingula anatina]|eukprot:XP_013403337.1 52 kDa repressor of the inhibitor of the protein kinase [Lingula anatina]